jgi:WD40 repeat protein
MALCVALGDAVAQTRSPLSLDEAISDAVRYLNTVIPLRSKVAFIHFGSSAALQEYLLENLTNKLKPNPQLGVVERRNSSPTIKQFNLPTTGDLPDSTIRDIGKRLNVNVVVSGSITLTDSVYRFRIQAIAVQSNQMFWTHTYIIKSDRNFLSMFNAGAPPPPAATAPARPPAPPPAPSANLPGNLPNPDNFQVLRTIESGASVLSLAWRPDGAQIISAYSNTINFWNVATGQRIKQLSGGDAPIVYSPDGQFIASRAGNSVRIWNAETGAYRVSEGHSSTVNTLAYSPDGQYIMSGSNDDTIRIWNAQSGQPLQTFNAGKDVEYAAYSPDGGRILAGVGSSVMMWNADNGQLLRNIAAPSSYSVYVVAWSPDGKRFAYNDLRNIKVCDAYTGQELWTLTGHKNTIRALVWSPDGRRLVSGSEDSAIKVWDPATGWETKTLPNGHTATVRALMFSPDGTRLASCSNDSTIKVWGVR